MYLNHWGMKHRPFDHTHNPARFVPLESHMLVLTKLRYAVAAELGACSLTGAAGAGKSEMLHLLLNEFGEMGWTGVYVANPARPRQEVLEHIAAAVGADGDLARPVVRRIEERFVALAEGGGKVLLAVDDIHTATDPALTEDLRLLLNITHQGDPVATMVVAGQPGTERVLAKTSRFDTRLSLKIRLGRLNEEDTKTYILARLKEAGCARGIFTRRAADRIADASGGLPGNINRICELCLVIAFGLGQERIGPEIVQMAVVDLGLEEHAATQALLDSVWTEELPPVETGDEDILASLLASGEGAGEDG